MRFQSAIINKSSSACAVNGSSPTSDYPLSAQLIPVDTIIPNRYQPRKAFDSASLLRLADSIRRYGILQPITVRYTDNPSASSVKYEIICGERRYRAAIIAGISFIPCVIMTSNDMNSAELSIIENLLRDDLNIFEQAEGFNLLISTFSLTQEEVANRVSLSQSAVANKLRLLKFSQQERSLIISSGLTERHARSLLRISDTETRIRFIKIIAKDKLNVASTEALIDNYIQYIADRQQSPSRCDGKSNHSPKLSTGIVKDLRVLTNTLEKAAGTLRKSGIAVEISLSEQETCYSYTLRVFKKTSPDK